MIILEEYTGKQDFSEGKGQDDSGKKWKSNLTVIFTSKGDLHSSKPFTCIRLLKILRFLLPTWPERKSSERY